MDTRTEQVWRERVRQYEASGLSAGKFAQREGFHQTTLSKYVRLFGGASPGAALALAHVQAGTGAATIVPPSAAADGAVEIAVGRGVVVRVRRGFDEQVLQSVLRVLVGAT
jgi:hypothetical protein